MRRNVPNNEGQVDATDAPPGYRAVLDVDGSSAACNRCSLLGTRVGHCKEALKGHHCLGGSGRRDKCNVVFEAITEVLNET